MRKGYTVRMSWNWSFGDTVLVVSNMKSVNQVVCFPFVEFNRIEKTASDVGMWKIKQLKN